MSVVCCTSMPHSRTCPATFLASGQSSGVPSALQDARQCPMPPHSSCASSRTVAPYWIAYQISSRRSTLIDPVVLLLLHVLRVIRSPCSCLNFARSHCRQRSSQYCRLPHHRKVAGGWALLWSPIFVFSYIGSSRCRAGKKAIHEHLGKHENTRKATRKPLRSPPSRPTIWITNHDATPTLEDPTLKVFMSHQATRQRRCTNWAGGKAVSAETGRTFLA